LPGPANCNHVKKSAKGKSVNRDPEAFGPGFFVFGPILPDAGGFL